MRRSKQICALLLTSSLTVASSYGTDRGLETPQSWRDVCKCGKMYQPMHRTLALSIAGYRADPNNETCFFLGVDAYKTQKQWQLVQKLSADAIKAHPSWAAPHSFLGDCYLRAIDDDEALAEYRKAVELKPCFAPAQLSYTTTLYNMGQFKESINAADAALKYCDPNDDLSANFRYLILIQKGKALTALSDPKKAAEVLEQTVHLPLYQTHPLGRVLLCRSYLQTKQWTKALDIANFMVKKIDAPDQQFPLLLRAQAYAGLGRTEIALNDVSAFLARQPDSPNAMDEIRQGYALRATLYEKLGKKDLAARDHAKLQGRDSNFYNLTPFRSQPTPVRN